MYRRARGQQVTPLQQQHSGNGPAYPMMPLKGLSAIPNPARLNGEDIDNTPRQFRRFVNASGVQDVQINNGLHNGIGRGINLAVALIAGHTGYLYAAAPIIPGQTRGDAGGFHVKGPAPANWDNYVQAGPGSQPDNPGGPGKIAGPIIVNPMSG